MIRCNDKSHAGSINFLADEGIFNAIRVKESGKTYNSLLTYVYSPDWKRDMETYGDTTWVAV